MPSLLGIDSGLTVTKAVLFDVDGTPLSIARRRLAPSMPRARHVERDLPTFWRATAEAISEALSTGARPASDVLAVAPTAHGDGVYLLDADRQPLGPGILSLDSRAEDLIAAWRQGSVSSEALALSGQVPHASAPSTLLAWLRQHQPERFARIAHVLACKDWLRHCLTGTIGTDRTEASTAFTDVRTQRYSDRVLALFGLSALSTALPPVDHSAALIGEITPEAAAATGLRPGTPVAAGLHDVTASALGIGAHVPGVLGVIAGTYSINEIVSDSPRVDSGWFCRNAIEPGRWNSMAISPASTANYDWFIDTLCASERDRASQAGETIHARLDPEIEAALQRDSTLLFHPYLFGSPHGERASASFTGLHGWHERGDLLRAVLEGVAFNHRTHIDALRRGFQVRDVRLTGGVSRNPAFAQLFCDTIGLPVQVPDIDEAAARGAALCAGVAAGVYPSLQQAPPLADGSVRLHRPDPHRQARLERRFELFTRIAETLRGHWSELEALGAPAATDETEPS